MLAVVLNTNAPWTGFCKPAVLLTFGGTIILFVDRPAVEKSTALWTTVTPTPIAPTDNIVCDAFIPTPGKIVDVWIPTVPVLETKTLSFTASLILNGLVISGLVPIPIEVIDASEIVAIPAIVRLFSVDIPTVAFEYPEGFLKHYQ